jgi:electron transfer flavoprotein beta subunit
MRVMVLVKQVPATEKVKIDESTGTMVRTGMEAVLNPLDLYAVEEAVRLKEQLGDVWVSVLTMGPPMASDAVREALALGCDDGFLLTGKEFVGSDTWATAYALSRTVTHLGPCDMVLCGERATDGETGQVGPMVGTLLDLPVLTYVSEIMRLAADRVVVRRTIEGGHEVVEAPLPVQLSVVKEINEPRLPTLAWKMRARRADVRVLSASDIGVDGNQTGLAGSPTRVVSVFHPTISRRGELVSTATLSPKECVERLFDFLRAKGIA